MYERPLSPRVGSEDQDTGAAVCEVSAVPAEGDFCPFLKVVARPAGERTAVAVSGEIGTDTERHLRRSPREALTRSTSGLGFDLTGTDFCILPRTAERTRRMG
jgi:hypothetical protein